MSARKTAGDVCELYTFIGMKQSIYNAIVKRLQNDLVLINNQFIAHHAVSAFFFCQV